MNDKNVAIMALTIIAAINMIIFKNESQDILLAVIGGILGLTNSLHQGK